MRTPVLAGAAVAMLLCACQRDRHFHTLAVYETPASRCALRIEATGRVPAGHDVAAEATGHMTLTRAVDVQGFTPPPVSAEIALRDSHVALDPETPTVEGQARLLEWVRSSGCVLAAGEAEELASAVDGVLLGPRLTYSSGQTKVLRVVMTKIEG